MASDECAVAGCRDGRASGVVNRTRDSVQGRTSFLLLLKARMAAERVAVEPAQRQYFCRRSIPVALRPARGEGRASCARASVCLLMYGVY